LNRDSDTFRPMPVAVVLSHAEVAHELGHVGVWLEREGFSVERMFREDDPDVPSGDVLISLGSPCSVAEGFTESAARREIALVRDWVAADRPFLGVCFGAQVLARANGGSVRRMPITHRAYESLELATGAPCELGGSWAVWHEDAISAPPASAVVATLPHADVVFRSGRGWGVQPHIEFDSAIVRRLVERMAVKAGEWEALHAALEADEADHARRSLALLDLIAQSW